MKKFLVKISFFTLLIVSLLIILDKVFSVYLSKSKYHSSGEFNVWNDIYAGNINAEILIYGSSRAFNQIKPQILEENLNRSCYNLGIEGHNFWVQYLRHLEYLKKNKPPKYIIVSFDLWAMDKRYDLYNYTQFIPYMLFNKNIYKYTSSYEGFKLPDYFIPFYRYIGKRGVINEAIRNIFIEDKRMNNYRIKGYNSSDKEWNDDLDNAKDSMRYYVSGTDTATLQLFQNFIKECKEKDITPVFVYVPEYIEGQKFTINRQDVIARYINFSEIYNIPFFDYSGDDMCLNKDYFYNASHLNKTGSEIFTQKFVNDLMAHPALKDLKKN